MNPSERDLKGFINHLMPLITFSVGLHIGIIYVTIVNSLYLWDAYMLLHIEVVAVDHEQLVILFDS